MRHYLAALLLVFGCDSNSAAATAPNANASVAADPPAATPAGTERVAVRVTKEGFVPNEVKVPRGKPVVIEFTRETESECLNAVRVPWLKDTVPLPLGKPTAIAFDTSKAGTVTYACWMNMVFGKITVTEP